MNEFAVEMLPRGLCIAMAIVIFPKITIEIILAPFKFLHWILNSLRVGIGMFATVWNECGRNYISAIYSKRLVEFDFAQVLWCEILKKYPKIKSDFHGRMANIYITINHNDGRSEEVKLQYCIREYRGKYDFTIEEVPEGRTFNSWREFDDFMKLIIKHPQLKSRPRFL